MFLIYEFSYELRDSFSHIETIIRSVKDLLMNVGDQFSKDEVGQLLRLTGSLNFKNLKIYKNVG